MVQETGLERKHVPFKPRVVLLAGYAQAGKDTVGDYLVGQYGFTKFKFAQPLYDMLAAMYKGVVFQGEIESWMQGDKTQRMPESHNECTIRAALQTLGTEWGRGVVGDTIWTRLLIRKIQITQSILQDVKQLNAVVTDCRFPNEWDLVNLTFPHALLAVVDRQGQSKPGHTLQHASENHIGFLTNRAGWLLENNSSIDALHADVDMMMKMFNFAHYSSSPTPIQKTTGGKDGVPT